MWTGLAAQFWVNTCPWGAPREPQQGGNSGSSLSNPNPMSAVITFDEKMKTGPLKPNGAAEFHKTSTLTGPTARSFM